MVVAGEAEVQIAAHAEQNISINMALPEKPGGYLLLSEMTDAENIVQISRRFIRVGNQDDISNFPVVEIEIPTN